MLQFNRKMVRPWKITRRTWSIERMMDWAIERVSARAGKRSCERLSERSSEYQNHSFGFQTQVISLQRSQKNVRIVKQGFRTSESSYRTSTYSFLMLIQVFGHQNEAFTFSEMREKCSGIKHKILN